MAIPALRVIPAPVFADAAHVACHVQPEEALFCFSATTLKERLERFSRGFPGQVSFAVKSNPSPEVITALAEAGLRHWDVASVHEMALVQSISADAIFHYHNPVKSRRERSSWRWVPSCTAGWRESSG